MSAQNIIAWHDNASGEQEQAVLETPFGKFALSAATGVLLHCDWVADDVPLQKPESAFLLALSLQLQRFWDAPRSTRLHAPLQRQRSAFAQRVWEALCQIPCGQTRSYGELAKQLQTSPRAIGAACRNNPYTLFIPCHRVVAATGLGGYAGEHEGTLPDLKRHLLQHEGAL